jgi:hypothetical protein
MTHARDFCCTFIMAFDTSLHPTFIYLTNIVKGSVSLSVSEASSLKPVDLR